MLRLGKGASIEPEVDLSGFWVDGDVVHVGTISVGTTGPGRRPQHAVSRASSSEADAEVAPGSLGLRHGARRRVLVRLAGRPGRPHGARAPGRTGPANSRAWVAAYGVVAASAVRASRLLGILAGVALPLLVVDDPDGTTPTSARPAPVATGLDAVGLLTVAVLVLGRGPAAADAATVAGVHPVRSRPALAVWTTIRVLDEARTWLFPLYSSMLTPTWLRLLGARIGHDVEASTVLMMPSLTQVNDQAFLADDTLIGGYELGGGWLRVERVKIGKRAFVGNSGMAAPGRKVPKASLVAVLSAAPRRKTARSGESWLGSPPAALRRVAADSDAGRTYAPPTRLKVARAAVELCRLVPLEPGESGSWRRSRSR